MIDGSTNIARDFKAAMMKAIDNRFVKYLLFQDTNQDMLLASIATPRIKTNFIADDDNIMYVKRLLITECKKMKNANVEVNDTQQDECHNACDDDFIVSFASSRNVRRNSIDTEIESEVARFLCDTRTDYSMMNEFPNVREVFFKHNTTLASSAPVERVFSQSLMIFTPKRNGISGTNFEKALLLKHNRLLIEQTKN